jgi:AbrB family looped-hinge helix DNA binding protein
MDTTGNADYDETYGTVEIDGRGRLTIPKQLRDELHLDSGTEFRVVRESGDLRLVRQLPELQTLTRDGEWGDEAFRDAGTGTFGGRNTQ